MGKKDKGELLLFTQFRAIAVTCIYVLKPHRHWLCRYSDYTRTESGLQYQDLRQGTGKSAAPGAQVTVDWDGYTIGVHKFWHPSTGLSESNSYTCPALMLDCAEQVTMADRLKHGIR